MGQVSKVQSGQKTTSLLLATRRVLILSVLETKIILFRLPDLVQLVRQYLRIQCHVVSYTASIKAAKLII